MRECYEHNYWVYYEGDPSSYTFGPALRIPDVKNMGEHFAPEELRICP